ncbi:MAG: hypothetical protein KBG15_00535 [Kofleriaceae bacterium]|nr:hypothetical protein [Kofleriaceae bacterium]
MRNFRTMFCVAPLALALLASNASSAGADDDVDVTENSYGQTVEERIASHKVDEALTAAGNDVKASCGNAAFVVKLDWKTVDVAMSEKNLKKVDRTRVNAIETAGSTSLEAVTALKELCDDEEIGTAYKKQIKKFVALNLAVVYTGKLSSDAAKKFSKKGKVLNVVGEPFTSTGGSTKGSWKKIL